MAAAAAERFVAWCKQEQASIEQELELLVSGKVRIGEDIGSGWIDTTADSIERAKRRLAQLNELLTEEGKTTVVKPDAGSMPELNNPSLPCRPHRHPALRLS
jgi:hypothetical protein